MYKTDCELNNYVASWMKGYYEWVTNATADCEENYQVDDIRFSATTNTGHIIPRTMEVKSLKSGNLKVNGEWSNYFSTNNTNGITKKMMYGNVPPATMDILEGPYKWDPQSFAPEYSPMPEEWKDKHIYFLNAEDKYHRMDNSKAYKVLYDNAYLCYAAQDGILFFSPTTLRKAFLGYVWYRNKSHTEEIYGESYPVWELKYVIDLDKGSYHPWNAPKELFKKNKRFN